MSSILHQQPPSSVVTNNKTKSLGFSIDSIVGPRRASEIPKSPESRLLKDSLTLTPTDLSFKDSSSRSPPSGGLHHHHHPGAVSSIIPPHRPFSPQDEVGSHRSRSRSPRSPGLADHSEKRSPSPNSSLNRLSVDDRSPTSSPTNNSLIRPIPTSHFPGLAGAAALPPGLQQSYLDTLKAFYERNSAAAAAAGLPPQHHLGAGVPPPTSAAASLAAASGENGRSTSPVTSRPGGASPPTMQPSSTTTGPPPSLGHMGGGHHGLPPGLGPLGAGLMGLHRPPHAGMPPMFMHGGGPPQIPREYPLYPWFLSRHRFPGGKF